MTTIFYKKILGLYEISEISEVCDGCIRIEFEEPLNAKLVISDLVLDVSCGVCSINADKLSDGEYAPKLYTGTVMQSIEGFIVKKGAVIQKNYDDDYVRRLSGTVDTLLHRIQSLEAAMNEVQDKIERKIVF